MLLNTGAVSTACRIDRIEIVIHNLKILIVKHTILNLLSLSLRLYDAYKVRLATLKARLARELLPAGLENFRKQLQHGLACERAAIPLQRKGKGSDGKQVQGCLTVF